MKRQVKPEINKLSRVLKYLLYLTEFALFFILENSASAFPLIFSVKPMLVLSLLIVISLLESEMSTIFFALGAGFLLDVGVAPAGLSSLFLCIVCTFLSAFAKKKFHVRILSAVLSTVVVAAMYSLFIWLSSYVFTGSAKAMVLLLDRFIPSYLYTVLISPLMYILNLLIFRAFRQKAKR